MSDTFAQFKLEVEKDFVRKDALADFSARMDVQLTGINTKMDKIFDKIDEIKDHHFNNKN